MARPALDDEDDGIPGDVDIPQDDDEQDDWAGLRDEGAGKFGARNVAHGGGKRLDIREPLAQCAVAGAVSWSVEQRNVMTGVPQYMDVIPIDMEKAEFIAKFERSIPKTGDDPAVFYLTSLDASGNPIGNVVGKPRTIHMPATSPLVMRVREHLASQRPAVAFGGGDGAMGGLLQRMLDQAEAARAEAVRDAKEARAAAQKAQDDASRLRFSTAEAQRSEVVQTYDGILTTQERLQAAADKRREDAENARAAREKEAREAEKEAAKRDYDAKVEAIKAETTIRLAAIKLESDKLAQAAIDAKADRAEERRLQDKRDDDRRKEEADRRKTERDDAAETRRQEETRRDNYNLAMAKIAADAAAATEARRITADAADADRRKSADVERERYFQATLTTMKERNPPADSDGLGVIGKLLNTFNMTPGDVLDKAKEFMSGSSADGMGAVAIKEIGGLLKEVVKRFPIPEDGDTEEEEEEEEAEEVKPPKKKPAIEEKSDIAGLLNAGRPKVEETVGNLPAVVPVVAAPVPAFTGSLREAKDGRAATRTLLERLKDTPETAWGQIVTELATSSTLVTWFAKRGLLAALAEQGAEKHAATIGRILKELGLEG